MPSALPGVQPGNFAYAASSSVKVKKQRGVLFKLFAFALGLVVVSVVVGVGVVSVLFGNNPPQALDDYMHGKGVAYTIPHAPMNVRLPEKPLVETDNTSIAGHTLKEQMSSIKHDTYEMGIVVIDLPIKMAAGDARDGLRNALSEDTSGGVSMDAKSIKDATVGGQPAVEGTGSLKGDQVAATMLFTNGKLYTLYVHTRHGALKVLHEFEASVNFGHK
jgi:hypothetical protein